MGITLAAFASIAEFDKSASQSLYSVRSKFFSPHLRMPYSFSRFSAPSPCPILIGIDRDMLRFAASAFVSADRNAGAILTSLLRHRDLIRAAVPPDVRWRLCPTGTFDFE